MRYYGCQSFFQTSSENSRRTFRTPYRPLAQGSDPCYTTKGDRISMDDIGQHQSVRSVERAISLLESLERARQSMRLGELAADVGISPATARRLLLVLASKGLVQKERDRYQIGYGVISMAQACLMESLLRRIAMEPATELAGITGQTVALYVRQGFQRIIILRAEGEHHLSFQTPIGERLPLHLGAGKVLAAEMPADELAALLRTIPEIRTSDGAVTNKNDLLAQLEEVRRNGYYISRAERKKHSISITVPVKVPDGEVAAALSVISMLDACDEETLTGFLPHLQQAAAFIAERYHRE